MPDYLFPALSHCLVVLETAKSSWIEWATLAAPLAGVVLGAGLAHWLSKRQDRERLKQEKLEEIFSACTELENELIAFIDDFIHSLRVNEDGEIECQRERRESLNRLKAIMDRLDFLMLVHMPSHGVLRSRLLQGVISIGMKISTTSSSVHQMEASSLDSRKKSLRDTRGHVVLGIRAVKEAAHTEARRRLGVKQ
ncbi:hypothetical protein ACGTNG_12630 [Halomonas sp. 1390]|uniref:hypothetical protein n=1 Tax=Halomonas sp. B23F22_3 TaxID=3459516 RepID=UPI00373F2BDC